jgi:membrane protease YdiL (CAAX protease family)
LLDTTGETDTRPTGVPWRPRDVVEATAAVFALIVLGLVILRLASEAFDGLDGDDIRPWGLALVEGLMVTAVWTFAVRRRRASWTSLGLRPVGPRAMYLLPLGVMVVSLLSAAAYAAAVSGLGVDLLQPPALDRDILGTGVQRVVAVIAIVAWGPFAEELFFRGFILAALVEPLGPLRAAVVSSALFAAAHVSIGAALPVFVTGMLLAWLYLRTRSIWPLVTAHALQNFIAVSVV